HLLEDLDPRGLRPANPTVQERRGEPLPRLLPEPTQVLLQVVGCRQGLVQLQRFLQPPLLILLRAALLGALEQQPPRPPEPLLVLPVRRLTVQGPARVRELLVAGLDPVEAVEAALRLGHLRRDPAPLPRRRAHGLRLDLGAEGPQPLPEGLKR